MLRFVIAIFLSLSISAFAQEQKAAPDDLVQEEGIRIGNFCNGIEAQETEALFKCVDEQCRQIFKTEKSFSTCRVVAAETVQKEIQRKNAAKERKADAPMSEPQSPEALLKKNCMRDFPQDTAKQGSCYNKQAGALTRMRTMLDQYPEGTPEGEILMQCGVESQDGETFDFVKQEQCTSTRIESYNKTKKPQ